MGRPIKYDTPEKYKEFIIASTILDKETGCWNWIKAKDKVGYGVVNYFGKNTYAHRASHWAFNDINFQVINNSQVYICHRCDNKSCCNPEHLFVGDNIINQEDSVIKRTGKLKPLGFRIERREAMKRFREKNQRSDRITKNSMDKNKCYEEIMKIDIKFNF